MKLTPKVCFWIVVLILVVASFSLIVSYQKKHQFEHLVLLTKNSYDNCVFYCVNDNHGGLHNMANDVVCKKHNLTWKQEECLGWCDPTRGLEFCE